MTVAMTRRDRSESLLRLGGRARRRDAPVPPRENAGRLSEATTTTVDFAATADTVSAPRRPAAPRHYSCRLRLAHKHILYKAESGSLLTQPHRKGAEKGKECSFHIRYEAACGMQNDDPRRGQQDGRMGMALAKGSAPVPSALAQWRRHPIPSGFHIQSSLLHIPLEYPKSHVTPPVLYTM